MASTKIVIGRRRAKETKFIRLISCRAVHPGVALASKTLSGGDLTDAGAMTRR
jgi:hypothetical protein